MEAVNRRIETEGEVRKMRMLRGFHGRGRGSVVALACFVVAGAVWLLFSGEAKQSELAATSQAARRGPTGSPQLVSIEPLPTISGEMCEWMPASTSTRLVAALRQERSAAEERTATEIDRAPVRIIHDPYPTYSAVAVDPLRNEIVLQDENLFQIMVYDRMSNTPPTATMSEPKRVIGGALTHVEFNCGLYIDPNNGDIYSVNNDMVDRMVVFSREQQGNVPPARELHTPHRTFGIAVDEEDQELYLTVQHPPQVVVYHKMASGEDKPIRVLEGGSTQLEDAHGIALDLKNQWMYVSNHGSVGSYTPGSGSFEPPSITVYPLKASGDTAPLRIIEGPKTQLNWPAQIYFDMEHQELFVANDTGDSILVFRATDNGNAAPVRVIQGPKTGLKNPTGVFVDAKNDELGVANMGNHSSTVYPRTANGNVAPLRTIRAAPQGKMAQAIGNPGAIGYDTKREEILVPN